MYPSFRVTNPLASPVIEFAFLLVTDSLLLPASIDPDHEHGKTVTVIIRISFFVANPAVPRLEGALFRPI